MKMLIEPLESRRQFSSTGIGLIVNSLPTSIPATSQPSISVDTKTVGSDGVVGTSSPTGQLVVVTVNGKTTYARRDDIGSTLAVAGLSADGITSVDLGDKSFQLVPLNDPPPQIASVFDLTKEVVANNPGVHLDPAATPNAKSNFFANDDLDIKSILE